MTNKQLEAKRILEEAMGEARRREQRLRYEEGSDEALPSGRHSITSTPEGQSPGLHQRLAEACGAPPLVTVPEGLHERLAAALGHRGRSGAPTVPEGLHERLAAALGHRGRRERGA